MTELNSSLRNSIRGKIFLNSTDRFGRSPLHLAIDQGLVDVASELVAYGANINVVTTMPFGHDRTPLIGAMFLKDSFQFVKFLVENKADVNQSDRKLKTPLHFAAELGQYMSAELLLQRDAKVNAQDSSGKTPLHVVFARRQIMPLMPFISLFQEYGADFNMLDNRGRSVMFHACRENLNFEYTEDDYDYDETKPETVYRKGGNPGLFRGDPVFSWAKRSNGVSGQQTWEFLHIGIGRPCKLRHH
ncbi:serine/threonine-protein phosphatase 6 regulatory ankyrin repeat subunit C-like [Bradysia coprophila]|uniref:serine/threonine-protein phosphatase 6 regulatory ankyrin repeat subunit C-like n=1 Tax=Bradysia coprophila TaxID=38358 RepID=UPI00187DA8A8|nr:serine/threonine-protein phosphatase 6 regulatory ankyrin repeat subunit C-like [Bradysia coprophila]